MFKKFIKRLKFSLRTYHSNDEQDDSNFYRCKVCGHVCNSDKVAVLGDRYDDTEYRDGVEYPTDSDGDYYPNVTSGCPFCGTLYSKNK